MGIFSATALDTMTEWMRARSPRDALRVLGASWPTLLRLGAGTRVVPRGPRPAEQLVLYEREGCPSSRLAREALAMLDLDALHLPVPEGSRRHARDLERLAGGKAVPVLVDRAMGKVVQGADAIVAHLFQHYGRGGIPLRLRIAATSRLASRLRGARGVSARPSRVPAQPLVLEGYEGSPTTRLVRERLSELELPFVARQLAAGSPRRRAYFAREGSMELPRLVDPERGISLVGESAIAAHLERTYALPRTAHHDGSNGARARTGARREEKTR